MVYGYTPFQRIVKQFAKLQAIINPRYIIQFPEIEDKFLMDVMKVNLPGSPKMIYFSRPHGRKTLDYKFRTQTSKSSNRNTTFIEYSILIGCFFSANAKIVLKRFFYHKARS